MLAEKSQLYSRTRSEAGVAATADPKSGLLLGPISLFSAIPSPLPGEDPGAHVDVPGISAQSNHVRVSPLELTGLYPSMLRADSCVTYLLALTFSAVLAFPNRS